MPLAKVAFLKRAWSGHGGTGRSGYTVPACVHHSDYTEIEKLVVGRLEEELFNILIFIHTNLHSII